jgi:anti-anti-sigma factor
VNDRRRVGIEHLGDVVHVCVTGDIDVSNYDDLLALVLAAGRDVRRVVLDLEAVGHLDSAGVRLVFDASRELGRHGVDLVLVRPTAQYAARVLSLTAVDQTVPAYDSVGDALVGE